jgi:outer membrane receptor protein involved in Fe transport
MRYMKLTLLAVISFSLLFSSLFISQAQTANGKIVGRITDATGAVIPGAAITATNTQTRVKSLATTDEVGHFEVLSLQIGTYTVEAKKNGFAPVLSPAYTLNINQTQRVDFKLPLAGTVQSVDVSIDAAKIDTVSSTLGGSVTERPLVDLPLNGRNILDLASLQPGVTDADNPGNNSAGTVSINGGRSDAVSYLLDGGNDSMLLSNEATFVPDPDSVEEFRILESTYAAEYGRNAGGVISIVTKSGTHDLHGTAFEFLRNPEFNAQGFFQKRFGLPKDVLKRHQFGGTLGGEFFIPNILPRHEKFFYFLSYQGQRLKDSVIGTGNALTTDEAVNGDFSAADPDTIGAVQQFLSDNPFFEPASPDSCNCRIDPNKFDPVAKAYLSTGIIPFNANGFLATSGSETNNFDQFNGKFDVILSPKDHLTVSLAHNNNPSIAPYGDPSFLPPVPFPTTTTFKEDVVNIDETHTFTPNILNDLRVVFQRLNQTQFVPNTTLPGPSDLGVGITPDKVTGPPIMWMDLANAPFGFIYGGPTILTNNTYAYSDDLTWVHHSHTFKFGAYFSPFQNNQQFAFIVDGLFDFFGLEGVNAPNSDYAQFLVGDPDDFFQGPNAPSNIRTKQTALYAQDQWQITKRISLNYGIRYEYSTPKSDTKGRTFSPVPGQQSTVFTGAPRGLLFPGDAGAPKGSNFPDKNDFSPRFGFAYDVNGRGTTVVHGGFGIFYDILSAEDNFQFNGQPPFFPDVGDFNFSVPVGDTTGPLGYLQDPYGSTGLTNPFPSQPPAKNIDFNSLGANPFGGAQFFIDPHLRTPYIMQYNLGFEQSLGHSTVVEVNYVGTRSRKLKALQDINPYAQDGSGNQLYNLANGLPDITGLSYTFMNTFRNVANSTYDALQVDLRKSPTHIYMLGTTYFQFSYTWGKTLDNASGFRQVNSIVPSYNANQFRSVSDFDVAQRIVLSGGWDLPFDDLLPRLTHTLTQGWSLYPIVSYRTGFPIDITDQLSQDGSEGPTGFGDPELVRVNLVGTHVTKLNPYATVPVDGGAPYISSSNFDPVVTSGYGTLPRNSFFGPGRTNVDMSIAKLTAITPNGRVKLELRGDFFNMFNITQFQNPNTSIGSSQFGEIQSNYDPREIQIAAKVRF